MKNYLLTLAIVICPMAITAATEQAQTQPIPAFPGAEGFARYTTTGGRGGTIVHVTNLNDSGAGSFREAVTAKNGNNRIIVFDVSGYIDLKSEIKIKNSNLTIAGQTAPGDGITIRYYTVTYQGNNIITRFIRFRRSQIMNVNDGADASWGRNMNNVIFDHCSFSWSIDELASFYDNQNFTFQWCTLGEALRNPGHSKGEHSYGGIWGGKGASFHHNYLCHMQNRVPRFNGARYNWDGWDKTKYESCVDAERVDLRNCVMYNWGTGGCYGGPGGGYANMINNYYQAGPATTHPYQVTDINVGAEGNSSGYPIYWGLSSRYYINGNYVEAAGENAENYDWKGVTYDTATKEAEKGHSHINGELYIPDPNHYYGSKVSYIKDSKNVDCVSVCLDEPIDCGEVTTHSAQDAYEKVLEYSGACLTRDAIDARYAEEARTGTTTYTGTITISGDGKSVTPLPGIIDLIQDPNANEDTRLVSYPALQSDSRPKGFDSDGDGMPDEWEEANGLNKNSANDAKLYTLDSNGWYTNIECYINSLVEYIVKAQNADAISTVEEYYPSLPSSTNDIKVLELSDQRILSIDYFDLSGHPMKTPCSGINIRRITWGDGSVSIERVVK